MLTDMATWWRLPREPAHLIGRHCWVSGPARSDYPPRCGNSLLLLKTPPVTAKCHAGGFRIEAQYPFTCDIIGFVLLKVPWGSREGEGIRGNKVDAGVDDEEEKLVWHEGGEFSFDFFESERSRRSDIKG